ncbi:ABC transporter related [Anaeromyxobacter dehalogenans 2CP-1]|uniref:ABC transporter related n=1 Tax=Anaeromyxobacter dehalogenans (strain ATCC BAA-258 / DSM 21875 / 2CP-1) TaxID=455488 RepID=B8JB16_ANAD2|nr:ABC transporter ATP-binding protein [Anaeromyxobacter dehalogenans]ACL63827.1 ABC transporter related [Anaeromyxobacter dehalogenans 2CP-1]
MIQLREVTKVFDEGRPGALAAVDRVTLEVAGGAVTVLVGPSGSGKTTLLTLLGAMARPTEGRIFLDGRELTSLPEHFLAALRRRTFGFVFQQNHLLPALTALENVMLPALPSGEPRRAVEARARAALARLGVEARAGVRAGRLSGGEAQRVALARALADDPKVIVADEPTAHLDSARARALMEIVRGLKAEGRTVVVASHDPIVYAADCVDRVVRMRDGRIVTPGAEP